jgi:hypothetical protein
MFLDLGLLDVGETYIGSEREALEIISYHLFWI